VPLINTLAQALFQRQGPTETQRIIQQYAQLQEIYGLDWLQHHFQFYRIPSLDLVQLPRMPALDANYRAVWLGGTAASPADPRFLTLRLWELTGTRHLLGLTSLPDLLAEPGASNRFRVAQAFELIPTASEQRALAQTNTPGPCALLEFTGALPRVGLYRTWQAGVADEEALRHLASPNFQPRQTVLVSEPLPAPPAPGGPEPDPVLIEQYEPKRIRLQTRADTATVLLVNDRHHPDWHVWVDGRPGSLLRCNYIMRGVHLPPGPHTVEWRYQPPFTGLYVSLGALALTAGVLGFLAGPGRRTRPPPT
jgi:hypothetical protein